MNSDKVRWGIISTARIAATAFVPAVRQTRRGEVTAVASRSRDKGESFAREHGIPQVFDDYASLLASDGIDAVYNPLPNTMHREWTEAAAAAGKHVFCEKPLATTAADAEAMVAACEEAGVVFFEAFVFLYHPQSLKLRRLIDKGAIGELLQLHAHMSFPIQRPTDNIRMNRALGGGSLYDGGSYPITFSRFAFGEEPAGLQSKVPDRPRLPRRHPRDPDPGILRRPDRIDPGRIRCIWGTGRGAVRKGSGDRDPQTLPSPGTVELRNSIGGERRGGLLRHRGGAVHACHRALPRLRARRGGAPGHGGQCGGDASRDRIRAGWSLRAGRGVRPTGQDPG